MKKSLQLILWIFALQLIGYGMGIITQANLEPWYASLDKSSLTPPGYVFGIVWGILYVVLAVVAWQLYLDKNNKKLDQLRAVFIAQLILNWLWTPVFFHLHWIGTALIFLIGIVLFTTRFLFLAWRQLRVSFWLMLPYWAWVFFASYLNFVIWFGNA